MSWAFCTAPGRQFHSNFQNNVPPGSVKLVVKLNGEISDGAAGECVHVYSTSVCCMQYVEVPVPTPKKGEVLVKVEASSVNIVDWRIQDGLLKYILPRKFPHIPGISLYSPTQIILTVQVAAHPTCP